MNELIGARGIAAILALVAANACSPRATPTAGARAPTVPVAGAPRTLATPASSAPAAADSGARRSPDGKMCGGLAGFQCLEKQYCSFAIDAHCGHDDMAGTCEPIPERCTTESVPVCGCDGKTYANACVAGQSSVSVSYSGACANDSGGAIADGKTCGTRGVIGDCSKASYCAYRSGCGAVDAGGTCNKKPELCPQLVAPVCGCDQKTYNNGCEAARAGTGVAAQGACKAE